MDNSIRNKLKHASVATAPSALAHAFFTGDPVNQKIVVSNTGIQFVDLNGQQQYIPFTNCTHFPQATPNIIGARGLLSSSPWVTFFDAAQTRFEFSTRWIAYDLLITPLNEFGFSTIDRD
jgi:hypothetical protein